MTHEGNIVYLRPTPAEMRAAYKANGDAIPANLDRLAPARGILRALFLSLCAWCAVIHGAAAVSRWVA